MKERDLPHNYEPKVPVEPEEVDFDRIPYLTEFVGFKAYTVLWDARNSFTPAAFEWIMQQAFQELLNNNYTQSEIKEAFEYDQENKRA